MWRAVIGKGVCRTVCGICNEEFMEVSDGEVVCAVTNGVCKVK